MRIFKALYAIKVLTPLGLWHFLSGLLKEGKSLTILLYYGAKMYPKRTALTYENTSLNYKELYSKSVNLASNLSENYKIKRGQRIALMAKNSINTAVSLFALSKTGANVHLLNPEMSESQFSRLCQQQKFDFIIYEVEEALKVTREFSEYNSATLSTLFEHSTHEFLDQAPVNSIKRQRAGNIVILTGGTTGDFKSASRKQSILNFLNPLSALINQVSLHNHKSVYIPTPIYHGFGLASLIVSILLGSEVYLTYGFNSKEGCKLIEKNKIEVVTLVPLMLSRMLNENALALVSLEKILSGGAPLNPGIVKRSMKQLGLKLYNLYGTSEAGFCILGSPSDLLEHPESTGRIIPGVKMRIDSKDQIGALEIQSKWTINSGKNRWVKTGDLARIDDTKLIFLKGRSDNMIISGGENVYPTDLENVLSMHNSVKSSAVIGIDDLEYGSRLKAFVSLNDQNDISATELMHWLKSKVARYQMPASIEFVKELPLTSIGKVNKKLLNHSQNHK